MHIEGYRILFVHTCASELVLEIRYDDIAEDQ